MPVAYNYLTCKVLNKNSLKNSDHVGYFCELVSAVFIDSIFLFQAMAAGLSGSASTSGTEEHQFESRQDVRFLGLCTLQCCFL
jgi:hypothetical protein